MSPQYYGPSQHFLMTVADRIKLYQRVIGFLHFADYRQKSLSRRMKWDLESALAEAQAINGNADPDPHRQMHLLRVLLAECLTEQSARTNRQRLMLECTATEGRDLTWNNRAR
jgi:hypothetical protein